ncbi:MAG: putative CRISPR-associated protein [bacterium]
MKNFIVSQCGTSIITNSTKSREDRELVINNSNLRNLDDLDISTKNSLLRIIEPIKADIKSKEVKDIKELSAELHGIAKFYEDNFRNRSQDVHYLVCTDTWLGKQTVEIVSQWLSQWNLTIIPYSPRDLQTSDLDSFEIALSDMTKSLYNIIPEYKQKGYQIVFNLTGGFKCVNGFLQTLAMFLADKSVYIFQSSTNLLTIPRLSIRLSYKDTIKDNLKLFRRISLGLNVEHSTLKDIPEMMLIDLDEEVTLSAWGEMAWNETKAEIYCDRLYDSPSGKIVYGNKFANIDLPKDRTKLINERIDQLARFLEDEKNPNPKSLNFKKLEGNPHPPSTHEFYAWSDADAKRVFGHYEENIFVIDKLDKHLP